MQWRRHELEKPNILQNLIIFLFRFSCLIQNNYKEINSECLLRLNMKRISVWEIPEQLLQHYTTISTARFAVSCEMHNTRMGIKITDICSTFIICHKYAVEHLKFTPVLLHSDNNRCQCGVSTPCDLAHVSAESSAMGWDLKYIKRRTQSQLMVTSVSDTQRKLSSFPETHVGP